MTGISSKQIFRFALDQRIDPAIIATFRARQNERGSDRKLQVIVEGEGRATPLSLTPSEIEAFLTKFPNYLITLPEKPPVTEIPARDSAGNVLGAMDPSSYLGAMHALREGRGLINPDGDYRSFGN